MIFFIVSFSILTLIYSYIGWRIIVPAKLSLSLNITLWITLIVIMLIPWMSIFLRIYGYEGVFTDLLGWIGYLSLGFFSIVLIFLIARDFVLLIMLGLQKFSLVVRSVIGSAVGHAGSPNPGRRSFVLNSINMGILGVSGILSLYGLYEARRRPRIVNVTVPVKDLPDDLEGFKIVQITDIHVGPTIKRDYVQTIVDETNILEPDMIVFTGDIADGTVATLRDDVAPLVELSAPCGSYFVTGNHEYYMGVEDWIKEIKQLGFKVLLNEHKIIEYGSGRILLAGVTDYEAGRFISSHTSSPETALKGAPANHAKILLAHQPLSIFEAARVGFDLQISGHTHGGQYYPWNYLVGIQHPYVSGLHLHEKTWIYVSRGCGYWGPPIRIGQPSEITMITLRRTNIA